MRVLDLVDRGKVRAFFLALFLVFECVTFTVPARAQNEYSGAVTVKSLSWHWVRYSRRVCNLPRGCPWSWNWSTEYSYTCYNLLRGANGYFILLGSSSYSPNNCILHTSGTYKIAHVGGGIIVYSSVMNPDGSSNDVAYQYVTWGEEPYSSATCSSLGLNYCP